MEDDVTDCLEFAASRIRQLDDEAAQLRSRLVWIRIVGLPLLVLSIVCPIAAGSIAIGTLLGPANPLIAILSFVGAAAVAMHRLLGCDTHQAALRRGIQSLRSLVETYEALSIAAKAEVRTKLEAAEARLAEVRASNADLPPTRRPPPSAVAHPDLARSGRGSGSHAGS